jgi:hypothetical protein
MEFMDIDWNAIQWYERTRGTSAVVGPSISIGKNGRISLNEQAATLHGAAPEAYQVGLIRGTRGKVTLVLQAAAKSDKGALALSHVGRKYGLNTIKFMTDNELEKFFGSEYTNLEYDQEHNAIIVSL